MQIKELSQILLEEHSKVFERLDPDMVNKFIETIKKHNRIFFIGVGREGMMTRAFAMRIMHMGKEVHWIWDDTTPSVGEGDLLVATNGSGEIGHINYVIEKAKSNGADIAVVTGSRISTAAKATKTETVLFVPASVYKGKDEVVPSIQPMGNLFEQSILLLFDIIVMQLVDENDQLNFEKMAARHRNVE